MRRTLRLVLPVLLLPIGCSREPTTSQPPQEAARAGGLMEITITGIGTPHQRATVQALRAARIPATGSAVAAAGPRPDLRAAYGGGGRALTVLPDTDGTEYTGTVQLEAVSTGSFTWGTRAGGGYRYVSATYKVRNATEEGVAYRDVRNNLTFLAVSTSLTLSGTAIRTLKRFDGSNAASGLAAQVLPTGWAVLSPSATLTARAPDVLQVYAEEEIAKGPTLADGYLLPYGFVVGNPGSTTSRTLAAEPAGDQFDGLVTFAFKVPLQATANDDPFTISVMVLPVDDSEDWVTQSAEEQGADADAAAENRAASLVASMRSLVGTLTGTTSTDLMCNVRVSGTAAAPTSFLPAATAVDTVVPYPYDSSASFLASNASFAATFGRAMSGATATTFAVNSFQRGRAFTGGGYGGAGTATLSTPAGAFWAGDVVEVALTTSLACPPRVYRYRVATGMGTVDFDTGGTYTAGSTPVSVALGDVNGDGKLDLVVGFMWGGAAGGDSIAVLLGNGSGGFGTPSDTIAVGGDPYVALGDVNGDGKLDIVAATSGSVTVLLGSGSGTFSQASGSPYSAGGTRVALGDIDGDGNLDIVSTGPDEVAVLRGDGAGLFAAVSGSPFSATGASGVALGDVNRDGRLDIVTSGVNVLLNDGAGGFTKSTPSGPGSEVALGDINLDGDLDIVTAKYDANVRVMLGDGAGAFGTATAFAVPSTPFGVALGDVNGDGTLDIVTANWEHSSVSVLLGDGDGNFSAATGRTFGVTAKPSAVALGAFNTLGKLDMAVPGMMWAQVTILLNPTPP